MRSGRFDHLLAGTALAVVMALTTCAGSALAQSANASPNPAPTSESATRPTESASPAPLKVEDFNAPAPAPAQPATGEVTSSVAPATPAAQATAVSIDGRIAERLRDNLAAGKFDQILGGRKQRAAVEAFYAGRAFAPLWITDGAMNERAKSAADYLAGVDADGLDPADYAIPAFKAGSEPAALAEAEIRLTDTVMTFANHAQNGRVHYTRVAGDIAYAHERPEPADVLGKLAAGNDARAALDRFQPQHPAYKALKAELAKIRNAPPPEPKKPEATIRIPEGKLLRPAMSDPRVVTLRKRLKIAGDGAVYDDAVVEAVKAFQLEANLEPDGMLGPNTLRALNGEQYARRPATNPVDAILLNLERWRWLPHDLGRTHVVVNIPDFSLRVVRDNKLVWKTKIVAGKPSQPTPILSAEMKYITVNPTWNVPPSIIQNEYLPAVQQDPTVLERMGLKIAQDQDGTVRIWQPPGDRNALGRIRFNFPNKFLVYQHDTPDKHLFKHDRRAYSHGCMRVEDPLKYGEVLLSLVLPNEKYTQDKLRGMYGNSEVNISFPTTIPVHLTYQTAFVNDEGKLVIRDDVYGRDARQLAVMKGSERKVADTAIDRPRTNFAAPVRMTPGTFGDGGGFFSGPSLFDRLFGGTSSSEPPRPRARVGRNERHNIR